MVVEPDPDTGEMRPAVNAGLTVYVPPSLSYNSLNSGTGTEIGNGWSHTFRRSVVGGRLVVAVVTWGSGQSYTYQAMRGTGGAFLIPAPGSAAVNSLFASTGFTTYIETQPDGTAFKYLGPGSSPSTGPLVSITNPAGSIWTITQGSVGVNSVADPTGRLTSFSYNATSGKITSIQDCYGRITSMSVNSSGNLVQVTTPELCLYSFVYDSSNRLTCRINPLGDCTSFTFDGSNRVTSVMTPLGQITTLAYGTNQTVVTNPLGIPTTLNFTSGGAAIASAIDGAGNLTTYTWGSNNNNSTSITNGLGQTTSFAYVTNATTSIPFLSSIQQPLGGIFTYSYNGVSSAFKTSDMSARSRIKSTNGLSPWAHWASQSQSVLRATKNPWRFRMSC